MRNTYFRRRGSTLLGAAAAVASLALSAPAAQALTFTFNPVGAPPPTAQAIQGFMDAGALWSAQFTDVMNVNINIGFRALGAGILAQAGSTEANYNYLNVRNSLIADVTSGDDATSSAATQAGAAFRLLINRTADNPSGNGSAVPYFDNDGGANNSTIRMSNANAKALGLLAGNNAAVDATIEFNSNFAFDFDRSDGIAAGQFDFVGLAVHEIGHALGFISGVDTLDFNAPNPPNPTPFGDNAYTFVSTLDLFRFSTDSINPASGLPSDPGVLKGGVGVMDWTADNFPKYFSVDGGVTAIANYATGVRFGDGRQASHWKDNLGLGVMDPTAAQGELLAISTNDLRAFDVIGYNRAVAPAVPEFGTVAGFGALLGMGGLGLIRARRSRRHQA